ncbi:MAG: hypothetical protein U0414_29960 [Polyangiaceae bacterium]
MAGEDQRPRVRVADLIQKAGDRLRGVFTEGPNPTLLNDLRSVEPERDPLGLPPRALGVLVIESDEMAIVIDPKDDPRRALFVKIAAGAVAISGGIFVRPGSAREGYLRWAVLRISPERVHEWTFAARTADRIVVVRDRAILADAGAKEDLSDARSRLRTHRVAILEKRRYAMLMGEAPAKIVIGKDRANRVVAVALDFSP